MSVEKCILIVRSDYMQQLKECKEGKKDEEINIHREAMRCPCKSKSKRNGLQKGDIHASQVSRNAGGSIAQEKSKT